MQFIYCFKVNTRKLKMFATKESKRFPADNKNNKFHTTQKNTNIYRFVNSFFRTFSFLRLFKDPSDLLNS